MASIDCTSTRQNAQPTEIFRAMFVGRRSALPNRVVTYSGENFLLRASGKELLQYTLIASPNGVYGRAGIGRFPEKLVSDFANAKVLPLVGYCHHDDQQTRMDTLTRALYDLLPDDAVARLTADAMREQSKSPLFMPIRNFFI